MLDRKIGKTEETGNQGHSHSFVLTVRVSLTATGSQRESSRDSSDSMRLCQRWTLEGCPPKHETRWKIETVFDCASCASAKSGHDRFPSC
ncbi:hypothetical protein RRG08_043856 [Elysia crispata]|uniref:Uncharacterized protein n=1 Tax=Elysia crispata TaxID=231223 RepID=A0AAE0XUE8_9GAST|nr:hypothetical protein RRG08_043856 [Elysia crispata]